MKRCAIYARVSTADQRVDNQLTTLGSSPLSVGLKLSLSSQMSASPAENVAAPVSMRCSAMLGRGSSQCSSSPHSIDSHAPRGIFSPSWTSWTVSGLSSSAAARTSQPMERWGGFSLLSSPQSRNSKPTSSRNVYEPGFGDGDLKVCRLGGNHSPWIERPSWPTGLAVSP